MKKWILLAFGIMTTAAAFADDGWQEMSRDEKVVTWKKEIEGSPVVAFRGEAVVHASIAKVANVLYETKRKLEWVAHAVEAKDIHLYSAENRIEYNHTGTPWPLKDRDFLFRATVELNKAKKQLVIHMKSVKDDAMPEQDCCVRGELLESNYILTSVDDGKNTNVVVEIHADPMGGVPKWIVNLFQKGWPRTTLENIQKQVAKPDVTELAEVKRYFENKTEAGVSAVAKPAAGSELN